MASSEKPEDFTLMNLEQVVNDTDDTEIEGDTSSLSLVPLSEKELPYVGVEAGTIKDVSKHLNEYAEKVGGRWSTGTLELEPSHEESGTPDEDDKFWQT